MGRRKCVSAGVTHVSEDTSTSSDEEAVEANQGTMALYRGDPQKVGELATKKFRSGKSDQEVHGRKRNHSCFDQRSADG